LNFHGITSSSSSDDEEEANCEDVGEDSMPAVHSHHAAWAEYYYQKVYQHGDQEGLENLCDEDDDEMSLGNFYTDLEKQPQLRKYSTMSEGGNGHEGCTPHNVGSQKTEQGTMSIQTNSVTKNDLKSVSSNAHMKSQSPSCNAVEEILDKSSG
jgi:hypothetical protein